MIALIQRVSEARVRVGGEIVGEIGRGVLALIGVRRGDGEAAVERLLERLLSYRVFPDADGRMNLSVREVGGGLLLVPQFTLAADTRKGTRAGFSAAAGTAIVAAPTIAASSGLRMKFGRLTGSCSIRNRGPRSV